jgi:taurine dioxygenase
MEGDTLFASMTAAYTGLSERMKQYIHGLEATHDFKPWRHLFTSSERHQAKLREIEREYPNPSHPLVRVHPVTGRRLINVNAQFTTRIKGMKDDESLMLLQFLYSRAQIPELQLRVKWQPDTVVMWDNRSTQHYAPHDYFPQRRSHERVTIQGDPVFGVTGTYTPEEGVQALPDGHSHRSNGGAGKRAIREFERNTPNENEKAST